MQRINHRFSKFAVMTLALCGGIWATSVHADTIVLSDDFNSGTWATHTLSTNLPNSSWVSWGTNGFGVSLTGSRVRLSCGGDSNGLIAISIADAGSYTKPDQMILSADLNVSGFSRTDMAMGLGFLSAMPAAGATSGTGNFTGLRMRADGALSLTVNGAGSSPVAYTGTFDKTATHSLSYQIDLRDGSISNVVLDGRAYSFTTTGFTDAATTYAAVVKEWAGRDTSGYMDNFLLTAVPEPATLALLGIGGLLLIRRPNAAHVQG